MSSEESYYDPGKLSHVLKDYSWGSRVVPLGKSCSVPDRVAQPLIPALIPWRQRQGRPL